MFKWTKLKTVICVFGVIIFLLLLGSGWQARMQKIETERYRPIGTFVNVNAHDMHIYVKGSGTTCFAFMAGSGTPCAYSDFYNLQNEFSRQGKTISYDRAGYGWSEETAYSREVGVLAEELEVIMNKADAGNECILVCHSLASLEAIRFSQLYPDRVKGIVFLDGGSPEFYRKTSELQSHILNRVTAVLRFTGVNRLLGNLGLNLPFVGERNRLPLLPDGIKDIDRAMYNNYLGNAANITNIDLINENAQTVLNGTSLGDIPILVISTDSSDKWGNVQNELSKWSKNSQQVTIKNSGHYIHWTNQYEVIEEIKSFVEGIGR